MCGEQARLALYPKGCRGSPPRVRGTDADPVSVADSMGITPACAGNRPVDTLVYRAFSDHPRVCGEQK